MNKFKAIVFACMALLMAGCQSAAPELIPTSELAATTEPAATSTVLPATLTAPPEPTEAAIEIEPCVACHTDKDQLISTAKLEEVIESESSGVG